MSTAHFTARHDEIQVALLDYLRDRLAEDGPGPDSREVCAALQIGDRTLSRHLAELEERGVISRGGRGRSIRTMKLLKEVGH